MMHSGCEYVNVCVFVCVWVCVRTGIKIRQQQNVKTKIEHIKQRNVSSQCK